jgi:hypothetical protein
VTAVGSSLTPSTLKVPSCNCEVMLRSIDSYSCTQTVRHISLLGKCRFMIASLWLHNKTNVDAAAVQSEDTPTLRHEQNCKMINREPMDESSCGEATGPTLLKKLPAFYETSRFIIAFEKARNCSLSSDS